jgi:hypothetical protein
MILSTQCRVRVAGLIGMVVTENSCAAVEHIPAMTESYCLSRACPSVCQNTLIRGIRRHPEAQGSALDRYHIHSLVNQIDVNCAKPAHTWLLNHALAS